MNIKFLTLAQQEVDDVVLWFEAGQEGTSVDFLNALDEAIQFIKNYPFASTEIDLEPELRRHLIAGFPYSLVYSIEDETIVVIAVAHTHREPHYWNERIH